ncbi:MAG: serpin family protein [Oscillospiraceae bacterium]|nr:serpin family protein [Oscillospiraceae bacterium]
MMKRLLALVLSLCFVLGGCAQNTQHTEEGGGVMPAPNQTEQPAAASFEQLALRLAALPELPQEPDEGAFWDQLNALDYDKLGDEKYNEEYQKLWDAYSAQQDAYHEAVQSLRGDGVGDALTLPLTAYTFRTVQQLFEGVSEGNVVYSPANLYLALCMLAETTDGESRAQVLNLLGLGSVEQARGAASAIWRSLYRNGITDKTLLANSLWLNEQFDYHEDTVDTLARDYYASTFRSAMGESATDDAIRAWINENTNHLLENAANGLKTDANTLMMLISTLYFKGTWADQFEQFNTREDTFTTASGTEQTVDFMHRTKNGNYYRGEGFTVASLPFRDGAAMWFLLPDEGVSFDQITRNLPMMAVDTLEGCYELPALELAAQQGYGEIHWSVPKFDVDSDLDLIPALQALGVTDVFIDGAADFSPLTDLDALVSAVKHAARVKVDEEGCEAAAFTAIMVESTAAMPEQLPVVEMNLNRPFGFLITGVNGLPLFTGLVSTME